MKEERAYQHITLEFLDLYFNSPDRKKNLSIYYNFSRIDKKNNLI